uniref:Uncharacterized protein n=1 Tax=Rhizophora mucronata TaxID=61149 RepID=A0A2P2PH90_RHIMU
MQNKKTLLSLFQKHVCSLINCFSHYSHIDFFH